MIEQQVRTWDVANRYLRICECKRLVAERYKLLA